MNIYVNDVFFIYIQIFINLHCTLLHTIIMLLCLMPDDFTHEGESAGTQWVNYK